MVFTTIPVFAGMSLALVAIFVVLICYCGIKELKWHFGLPDSDFARAAH
jgi:hypothetical protein